MEAKKILIVNNNMHIGGVQKALIGFLNALKDTYDITLLLFNADGELMDEIPSEVHVIQTQSMYRYLGISQKECSGFSETIIRGAFAAIARILGGRYAFQLMSMLGKMDILGSFDAAVSYLHCAQPKSFYGGTAEYVLNYPNAKRKICFIHCDYANSGTVSSHSKEVYRKFDALVGVSKSVSNRVAEILPDMECKIFAAQNPIAVSSILLCAQESPYNYEPQYLNCLTVARLSKEKGIDRFIRVLGKLQNKKVRYYVAGEGGFRKQIEQEIQKLGLQDQVILLGEQINPYRLMAHADLLVVPSYHEAAPVVFQEARILNLPVLTTDTLSAKEMIPEACGFVVENNETAMEAQMRQILDAPGLLKEKKQGMNDNPYDASVMLNEIIRVIG